MSNQSVDHFMNHSKTLGISVVIYIDKIICETDNSVGILFVKICLTMKTALKSRDENCSPFD